MRLIPGLIIVLALATWASESGRVLELAFELEPDAYRKTGYSEPPQLAVWMEEIEGPAKMTLFLTRRTALNRWEGKLYCPSALPVWTSRFRAVYPIIRGRRQVPDAVSSATPKEEVRLRIPLPTQGVWRLCIEVNTAGDYNAAFPYKAPDGAPDLEGNGQPSLLYQGRLPDGQGKVDIRVVGRSGQWDEDGRVIEDLAGLDTALRIIRHIRADVRFL